jgi:tetratricopeptide (TPR) repeat protein
MTRLSRILPILAIAMLIAAVPYLAQNSGSVSGKVVGRDGQPAQNVQIRVDSLMTNNGRLAIREQLPTKTGKNGEFSLSGLYAGRIVVRVFENGQEVLSKGDRTGDEIFLANGIDYRVPTFDLSKAAAPAPAAAAAANTSGMSEAEKKALREKLEKEAAASGEASAAFEAGKVAFLAKDYPTAIDKFKVAAEKQPSQHVIWANLGKVYDAMKDYENAAAAYEKAITLAPLEGNYYLNLSLIQISSGKMAEGAASVKKAAELNPANAGMAYYNLGATLINRNKPDEAMDPLKKAIELDPNYAPAYYQLGMTMVQKGQLTEAPKMFEKCLSLGAACPDPTTAKALIDTLKATAPTTFQAPPTPAASKGKAKNP